MSDVPRLKMVGRGGWRQTNFKQGSLCDWSGDHIWPPVIGSKLEAGAQIRKASSYESRPGKLELTAGDYALASGWLLQIVS